MTTGSHLLPLSVLLTELDPERAAAVWTGSDRMRLSQTLIDAVEVVVFVADRAAAFRYLNATWSRLTGVPVTEALGADMLSFLHPQDHAALLGYLQQCQQSADRGEGVVLRWLTRGGDLVRIELRAQALSDAASQPLGFVGTIADVTRRTQAADVKQASHRTLETLIGNLPGMVYRCRNNPDWTMEFVSQGALELTGYTPEDLINNRLIAFADLEHPEDRQQVWDDVQAALRDNRPFELVYRILTAKGIEKSVLERGQGIFSTSGELLGLEGFITDVTAERRAALRQARNSLYESSTDLPTRALFVDRLGHALARLQSRGTGGFALLRVYLDRLAKLRANLGADFGDRVALEVSRRFRAVLRPVDSVCRWHEDEFAILAEQPQQQAAGTARELQETLRAPIVDREMELFLTASIGIVLSDSACKSAEDMLRDAAAAMARARELGGARFEVVTREPGARVAAPF
ncbi:MAG: PAS domain-containing protein [Chromatiales bacterium]